MCDTAINYLPMLVFYTIDPTNSLALDSRVIFLCVADFKLFVIS